MKKISLIVMLILAMTIGGAAAEEKKSDAYLIAETVDVGRTSSEVASKTILVKPGDYIKVVLYAAGGTGYGWALDSNPAIREIAKTTKPVDDKDLAGGQVKWEFTLFVKPEAAKASTLHFVLIRPWEKDQKPAQTFDLTANVEKPAIAGQTVKISKEEYQNHGSKVSFPQLSGITDKELQIRINDKLKAAIFSLSNPSPNSTIYGDFEVSFYNGVLLGLHFRGDSFTLGAAHPNKIDCGIHIDLTTGVIYNIEELFVKNADFVSRIREVCLANDACYRSKLEGLWQGWTYRNFASSWGEAEKAFLLGESAMRVYSIPNYAVGAISGYNVPYADLMDIIDTEGEFWKKLTKK